LPYNISIKLLIKWIYQYASNKWFKTMILMFQKEVAERIISKENSKKFGRISILASAFFSIKKIDEINKNNFFPSPKVDSVLLQFNALEKPHLTINDLPKLENLTKNFFSNRRKKIKKKIKNYFSEDLIYKHNLEKYFELRSENLSKEIFYFLTKLN